MMEGSLDAVLSDDLATQLQKGRAASSRNGFDVPAASNPPLGLPESLGRYAHEAPPTQLPA